MESSKGSVPAKNKEVQKNLDPESKRMTIQLGENLVRQLQRLAESQGISQVDAIRRAIGTEFYFRQEIEDGWKVLLQRDSEIKEVVIR